MSAPKITLQLRNLVEWTNIQLRSYEVSRDTKEMLCTMVEKFMRENDNYNGFVHLGSSDMNAEEFYSREYKLIKYHS